MAEAQDGKPPGEPVGSNGGCGTLNPLAFIGAGDEPACIYLGRKALQQQNMFIVTRAKWTLTGTQLDILRGKGY